MSRLHPLIAQLQARRLELGVSQHDVARAAGVHANTVSRWDTGAKTPSIDNLVAYARAVGLELELVDAAGRPRPAARLERRRQLLTEVEVALGNLEARIGPMRSRPAGTGPQWMTVAAAAGQEEAQAQACGSPTWALRARALLGDALVSAPGRGLRKALVALAAGVLAWLEDLDDPPPQ